MNRKSASALFGPSRELIAAHRGPAAQGGTDERKRPAQIRVIHHESRGDPVEHFGWIRSRVDRTHDDHAVGCHPPVAGIQLHQRVQRL